jgi:hybrid cluster-associated redox disulfide protein
MKKSSKIRAKNGVHKKMSFSELLEKHPEAAEELFGAGMHCAQCPIASFETIEQGANAHGLDSNELIKKINKKIKKKQVKNKIKKPIRIKKYG